MLRTQSLWWVLGLHTGWNWAENNVFGLSLGGNAPTAALVHLVPSTASNPWILGGEYGLEGGLPATVVLLGLVVGAYLSLRRNRFREGAASE